MPQVGLQVLPTRSIYDFDDSRVHVTLTFMTAALPQDLEALARPLSYLTWQVRSVDRAAHAVSIYESTSSALAVNTPAQKVTWTRETMGELTALRVGSEDQTLLAPMGDDVRIDWGYAYAVAPAGQSTSAIGPSKALARQFVARGTLPAQDDARMPRAVRDERAGDGLRLRPGKNRRRARFPPHDGGLRRNLFHQVLRQEAAPYWRRNGAAPAGMLQAAERDYPQLVKRCEAFDRELMADLTNAGGAALCADRGVGLSPVPGRHGSGGRRQGAAAAVHQGEHQQRRHRHRGRDFPHGADLRVALARRWPRPRWCRC